MLVESLPASCCPEISLPRDAHCAQRSSLPAVSTRWEDVVEVNWDTAGLGAAKLRQKKWQGMRGNPSSQSENPEGDAVKDSSGCDPGWVCHVLLIPLGQLCLGDRAELVLSAAGHLCRAGRLHRSLLDSCSHEFLLPCACQRVPRVLQVPLQPWQPVAVRQSTESRDVMFHFQRQPEEVI